MIGGEDVLPPEAKFVVVVVVIVTVPMRRIGRAVGMGFNVG